MKNEQLFHLAFVAAFLLLMRLRIYYHRLAKVWQNRNNRSEPLWMDVIRYGLAFPYIGAALAYLVRPGLFAWANFPLPEWARWLGVGLSFGSLPFAWWVHHNL